MVDHGDIMLAMLGAAAGLAGLVLVFLGLVVSSLQAYPAGTKPDIIKRARRPAVAVLVSFGIGIACVGTATWWLLLLDDNDCLYAVTVVLFFLQLASLAFATVWAVRRSLWG